MLIACCVPITVINIPRYCMKYNRSARQLFTMITAAESAALH